MRGVVARNLRLLMDAKKLRQLPLAEKAGIAQSSISAILKEKQAASLDTLEALATALDVPAWLLTWPDLSADDAGTVAQLVRFWQRSGPEGRDYILATAKRESTRAAS